MARQFYILVFVLIIAARRLQGQYYFYNDKYYHSLLLVEAGFSIGAMNCLTDLGGNKGRGKRFLKDINWQNTHPAGGIYLRTIYDQKFGARAELIFGRISASDNVLKSDHSEAQNRYYRNLHFQSRITEVSIMTEFLPLSLFNSENVPFLSPYLLVGIGFFKFNPQAQLKGQWYDLQLFHTEGQGFKEYPFKKPYNLTQMNFPVGVGVGYEISALLNVRLELIYRILNTDYLDDVSTKYIDPSFFYTNLRVQDVSTAQLLADRGYELRPGISNKEGEIRGNPLNKDSYFSFNIKIGLVLNRKRR